MASRPDIIVRSRGRTIAVVEVKGQPIPDRLREVVHEQLLRYAREDRSEWSILVDPRELTLYRADGMNAPVATVPTSDILRAASLDGSPDVGEGVLVLAVRRWLQGLSRDRTSPEPGLDDFVSAIAGSDDIAVEAQVA